MTTQQPAVRAGAILDALAFLDSFEPGSRALVLARVPPSAREAMLTTARSSWVSIEHDRHSIDAIIDVFGVPRAIQFSANSVMVTAPGSRNQPSMKR